MAYTEWLWIVLQSVVIACAVCAPLFIFGVCLYIFIHEAVEHDDDKQGAKDGESDI